MLVPNRAEDRVKGTFFGPGLKGGKSGEQPSLTIIQGCFVRFFRFVCVRLLVWRGSF